MARVVKVLKGIRNHWKKSAFAAAAVSYGVNYANESYKINRLMRDYCKEATAYGDVTQSATQPFKKVVVILNPTADRRSAATNYEEYCAPILNLGGLSIEVIQTDSEGHARRYIEEIDTLPAVILCAGGDGTLSEVVTGLLRRQHPNEPLSTIGVLPVGRTNTVAQTLFNYSSESRIDRVKGLANAAISVVRGKNEKRDVMKIEQIEDEARKPIYALATLEWGAFRDAFNRRDKYWYFGSLRDRVTFVFNAFDGSLIWSCDATVKTTDACAGCSNCFVKPIEVKQPRRWWSSFIRSAPKPIGIDYSKVKNDQCNVQREVQIQAPGVLLTTSNAENQTKETNNLPKINFKLAKATSGFDFISSSWQRLNTGKFDAESEQAVRTIEIIPIKSDEENAEKFYSIDNEAFEVRPIKITLQPRSVDFFVL